MELITLRPARVEIEHLNGFIGVFVNPAEILANADAADMVAELIRMLAIAHGSEQWIWGGCVSDAVRHANLPAGHRYMFPVAIELPAAA